MSTVLFVNNARTNKISVRYLAGACLSKRGELATFFHYRATLGTKI